jgi:hypothetical protein
MGRISKTEAPKEYKEVSSDNCRSLWRETNDCSVVAASILTGLSYRECHAAFTEAGRKKKTGTAYVTTLKAYLKLGFKLVRYDVHQHIQQYPGVHSGLKNVTTHHPRRFPKVWADVPDLLFHTTDHAAAFKGGVVRDHSINRSMRVNTAYRVVEYKEGE